MPPYEPDFTCCLYVRTPVSQSPFSSLRGEDSLAVKPISTLGHEGAGESTGGKESIDLPDIQRGQAPTYRRSKHRNAYKTTQTMTRTSDDI
jgi:hypothetical protein